MRIQKTVVLALLLAIAVAAGPASAVVVAIGENLGKVKDHSALYFTEDLGNYSAGDPLPLEDPSYLIAGVGKLEQRTIFQVTTLYDDNDVPYFDTSSPTELTGVLYDLRLVQTVLTPQGFVLDFAPLNRNPLTADIDGDCAAIPGVNPGPFPGVGGVLEVWEDAAKDYTPNPGGVIDYDDKLPPNAPATVPPPVPMDPGNAPSLWGPAVGGHSPLAMGAGADAFPTVAGPGEGAYWLAAALIDLNYLVGLGVVNAPAIPFFPGTVMRETIDLAAGDGKGIAYANVMGGSGEWMIGRDGLFPGSLIDVAMLFDMNTPILVDPDGVAGSGDEYYRDTLVYQGPGQWTIDSEDPVVFIGTIPEPGTMSLLGLGLVSLIGMRRRSRK
jgi:hypothetical protein